MNILITGVSRGLGRVLAINLLKKGYKVIGISRMNCNNKAIKELLSFNNFSYHKCNIINENEIITFINSIKIDLDIDVVVLNAAIMENDIHVGHGSKRYFDLNKFEEIFKINLFGSISFVDKILPFFQKRKRGIFIGISSLSVFRNTNLNKIAYSSTKIALNMAFEGFRTQIAENDIHFLTINFGSMGKTSGFFRISYDYASNKIISIIMKFQRKRYSILNKNIYNIPKITLLTMLLLRLLPDYFFKKIIRNY